jgi:hypothetical protein
MEIEASEFQEPFRQLLLRILLPSCSMKVLVKVSVDDEDNAGSQPLGLIISNMDVTKNTMSYSIYVPS